MVAVRNIPSTVVPKELLFPLNGTDVSREFDRQPPLTTPVGLNVRGFEALTLRARGGQRPGLLQYVPSRIGGAIQHLNTVVDPHIPAIPAYYEIVLGGSADGIYIAPGGRQIRLGGTGWQLNRGTPIPPSPPVPPFGPGSPGYISLLDSAASACYCPPSFQVCHCRPW